MTIDACPDGYTEADITQQGVGRPPSSEGEESDCRNPFQHDVDRILYSPEFRALAGKTQVVASDNFGVFHNRLTHSIKVAQLGRRMTQMLTAKAQQAFGGSVRVFGPSVDLVEAACLLHDIGHPIFGHIGEIALCDAIDATVLKGDDTDGFQANAQNFRIAISLSRRSGFLTGGAPMVRDAPGVGLNLTNATLDSTLKYPWARDHQTNANASAFRGVKHWCVYTSTEQGEILNVLEQRGAVPGTKQRLDPPAKNASLTIPRPVEEQIMDWADEITYVCHDLEDFTRAGLIPLDDIMAALDFQTSSPSSAQGNPPNMAELAHFTEYLRLTHQSDTTHEDSTDNNPTYSAIRDAFMILAGSLRPRSGTHGDSSSSRAQSMFSTTQLLNFFLTSTHLEPVTHGEGNDCALTGYHAKLVVDPQVRRIAVVLNKLVWCYVIEHPGLATQQAGQRRIIHELYAALADTKKSDALLSPYWKDIRNRLRQSDLNEDQAQHRVAADIVASMTEAEAVRMHRRITGIDYGQITDLM